ncbi:DUF2577 domain-containing protein [Clostridium botulinum]|uniref:DUF2577 family protein n=1 Tax=Clostridium botulinum TaxID=1491 RepID=UPI000A16F66F|nr:DUF2577 family protein [Clostridium botulinum]MBY6799551.1 DUF2577 family protein [Clostridium botulinum]NFF20898.1 DUF2577 domain-containing protein [Clostridium botulinum]NFM75492.1 DUF2577 domain-containing protein [Clostridium botulinum]NFP81044.1 DUF2577 domain-containing protein [Clostridium botulinum]NFP94016.1 DUF2577 domain-containing protein [Clostridium botulinum]
MDYGIEFAQWLKNRENKEKIGTTIGKVEKVGPNYRISIMDNQLYLDKSNSKLCNSLKDRVEERTVELNGVTYNAKIIYNVLNIGDTVLIVPDENNQFFYIIDKI